MSKEELIFHEAMNACGSLVSEDLLNRCYQFLESKSKYVNWVASKDPEELSDAIVKCVFDADENSGGDSLREEYSPLGVIMGYKM